MKKIFILLLSVVALLAFTIPAMALHGTQEQLDYTPSVVKAKNAQVELNGYFRMRGNTQDNTSDFKDSDNSGSNDDKNAGYDTRLRLGLTATVSPNTMGVVQLELENGYDDGHAWGEDIGGSGIYTAAGNSKIGTLGVRQAYISHQGTALTGSLSGLKVGHMLIALGNGSYYNHTKEGDDGIILWTQPMDGTEIAFAIIKGDENSGTLNGGDIDIYALTLETATGGISLSGDLSFLNDNAGTLEVTTGATDQDINLWNLGLRAGMDVGGATVNAGCDFQTGEVENYATINSKDLDLSGYQCQIKAAAKVGDIDVHGGFAYGSGDDITSQDDYEGFITSISSGGNVGTFVYDNKADTAGQTFNSAGATESSTYASTSTTGLANTWYLNVGATTNVTPDVSVNGEVFYLQASEKVSSTAGKDDEDIGVELDGKVTYQVDTALAYYVEAGILFAGDFYKNTTGATVSPDDAWAIRQGIVLTF